MERARPTSARVDLSAWSSVPTRALLFGEAQARVVISTPDPEAVLAIAARHDVPARTIGEVMAASAPFTIVVDGTTLAVAVSALAAASSPGETPIGSTVIALIFALPFYGVMILLGIAARD